MKCNLGRSHQATFAQIVESTRPLAAEMAWRRAVLASRVRHAAVAAHNRVSARMASRIKHRAILPTRRLWPEQIHIAPDDRFEVETFRIGLRGFGSLHLPYQFIASE